MTLNTPIGIFGRYESLMSQFDENLPKNIEIYTQDLLAHTAHDISNEVTIHRNTIEIPGKLIETLGTSKNDPEDISVPGLVLKINSK